MVLASSPLGFEDQGCESVLAEAASAYLTEIRRELFFSRIQKKFPGDLFKNIGRVCLQGFQHQPHHRGATFYVLCSRAKNSVSLRLPFEVIANFLFGRKDGVQMRYHHYGL